jgi:hypothetical protein
VEELIDAGDQVVSVGTSHARGKGSGVVVDVEHAATVWTIRHGKIVRVALHKSRAEALDAVGLWESAMLDEPPRDLDVLLRQRRSGRAVDLPPYGEWVIPGCAGGARSPGSRSDSSTHGLHSHSPRWV